ncbi:MAG: MotA/TolQ/ExbB proton channel family protein [Synergistaceae bacterium]|jgi:biopolymer transport protein ExbB/TolQ|nr:MotA/TolQ/ExbB proton channel family protein [Synergistaceae bacterium]
MNINALLQSAIYVISSSMMIPAMALLVGGFVVVVVSCGAFLAEWSARAGRAPRAGGHEDGPHLDARARSALSELDGILQTPGATWMEVESIWRAAKQGSWKNLDYLRILARLGPSMGLVGTLIPMSTGLASLSQGDASRLSSDLVVAFSTTVVGLCSGVAAYVLYTVRARWLEGDLENLRAIMESRAVRALDEREEEKQ